MTPERQELLAAANEIAAVAAAWDPFEVPPALNRLATEAGWGELLDQDGRVNWPADSLAKLPALVTWGIWVPGQVDPDDLTLNGLSPEDTCWALYRALKREERILASPDWPVYDLSGKITGAEQLLHLLEGRRPPVAQLELRLPELFAPTWCDLRDQLRLAIGYWEPVAHQALPQRILAHRASQPGLIAWAESDERRERDVWTVSRPGRLLRRFNPGATDGTIAAWAAELETDFELVWISWEEIPKVYASWANTGLRSCMTHPPEAWEGEGRLGGRHPTEAYGPGWELAVLRRKGKDAARALVYDDQGQRYFVRTYGLQGQLSARLQAAGVKCASNWWEVNARLRRIDLANPEPDGTATVLVPYLDGGGKVVASGDSLLIVGDDFLGAAPTSTAGWVRCATLNLRRRAA